MTAPYGAILEIPEFEESPGAVEATVDQVLAEADAALDRLAAQDLSVVTFATTIQRLTDPAAPPPLALGLWRFLRLRTFGLGQSRRLGQAGLHAAVDSRACRHRRFLDLCQHLFMLRQ